MKVTGIKFVVERTDKAITTWHCSLTQKVEQIILDVKESKAWGNGTVNEAYIEFDDNGEYCKTYLDCAKLTKILAE